MATALIPVEYDLEEMSLREIIQSRIKDLKISRYTLAFESGLRTAPTTTLRFLSGTNDTASAHVEDMLIFCGLKLICGHRVPPEVSVDGQIHRQVHRRRGAKRALSSKKRARCASPIKE